MVMKGEEETINRGQAVVIGDSTATTGTIEMAAKTEGKTIKDKGEAVNKEMRAKTGMVDAQEAIQGTEALLSG